MGFLHYQVAFLLVWVHFSGPAWLSSSPTSSKSSSLVEIPVCLSALAQFCSTQPFGLADHQKSTADYVFEMVCRLYRRQQWSILVYIQVFVKSADILNRQKEYINKITLTFPTWVFCDHSYVRGDVKYFLMIKNLHRFEICCLANICKAFSPMIIVMPNCFQQHCFPTYR